MQPSTITLANAVAWVVLVGLIGFALAVVENLGPFGLILLGLLTLFICTSYQLREDAAAWSADAFRARMTRPHSPELRAAMEDERVRSLAPLRFYRWCGAALLVVGIAGFAWQRMY